MKISKFLGAAVLSGAIMVLSNVPVAAAQPQNPVAQAASSERSAIYERKVRRAAREARAARVARRADHRANTPKPGQVASVPEIDAASGMAAFAAILAAMALAWERRRTA